MGKTISLAVSFAIFVLVAVVGYVKTGIKPEPMNPRIGIDKGVEQVRQNNQLKPSEESLLRVQLAINDYLIRNAMPPPSLASLVPAYFDAVPINPDTNAPYEYVKTGNSYRIGSPSETRMARNASSGETSAAKGGEKNTVGKMAVSAKSSKEPDFINPNLIEPDDFVYDATAKRDPFQPWDLEVGNKLDPNKSPIEQYDIKQLRLTAVLGDADGGRTGLVEDSFGKGYTVKVGSRIGNANGVIAAIEPGLLKVIETRVDFNGVEKQEVAELKIQASSLTASDRKNMKKGKLSSLSLKNEGRRKKP